MSTERVRIVDGVVSFVYSDDLAGLLDVGEATVERVSHVEPYDGSGVESFAARHDGCWWTADMRPVDGPVLGPFRMRADALQAERDWLLAHKGI